MSDPEISGKRVGALRILIWGTILAAAVLFWISVGAAVVAWMI